MQIIMIGGGDTFDTYEAYIKYLTDWKLDFERYRSPEKDWRSTLGTTLGPNFQIIAPPMPNTMNAKYLEWKIWFEKFIPYLDPELIFIGHSLGGIFLAKYLSERNLPKKIRGLFLVAAVHGNNDDPQDGYTVADFALPVSLQKCSDQAEEIFLYHSEDDPIVPFGDLSKYMASLPKAKSRVLKNRGHIFGQETFPELVADIKSL